MPTMRAVEGAGPYSHGIGALEAVGGGALDAPRRLCCFSHWTSGEKIQSSKSVILSERSESKDLRTIDTAKILRLPLVAQDDMV